MYVSSSFVRANVDTKKRRSHINFIFIKFLLPHLLSTAAKGPRNSYLDGNNGAPNFQHPLNSSTVLMVCLCVCVNVAHTHHSVGKVLNTTVGSGKTRGVRPGCFHHNCHGRHNSPALHTLHSHSIPASPNPPRFVNKNTAKIKSTESLTRKGKAQLRPQFDVSIVCLIRAEKQRKKLSLGS